MSGQGGPRGRQQWHRIPDVKTLLTFDLQTQSRGSLDSTAQALPCGCSKGVRVDIAKGSSLGRRPWTGLCWGRRAAVWTAPSQHSLTTLRLPQAPGWAVACGWGPRWSYVCCFQPLGTSKSAPGASSRPRTSSHSALLMPFPEGDLAWRRPHPQVPPHGDEWLSAQPLTDPPQGHRLCPHKADHSR